jgi:riboflavin synthase
MFTGIVQTTGVVQAVRPGATHTRLAIEAPKLPRPISTGASISVSGVCLTVTTSDPSSLEFDVIPETLSRTTLGSLRTGSHVNLEPSLRAGDPLDGHVVQGHIDGVARVNAISKDKDGHTVRFEADETLMSYIIPKGSVAIDGVSLTVAKVFGDEEFSVALIPTTLALTTLGQLRIGDRVNIETDIFVRTIVTTMQRWRGDTPAAAVTMDMLRENGF